MRSDMAGRVVRCLGVGPLVMLACASHAAAQGGDVAIEWEVANRFRLFAEQIDFDAHVRALRAVRSKTVLEIEQKLADESPRGIGWAAGVHRLCFDGWTGRVPAKCRRDGVEEDYLNPKDLRVKLTAKLPADFGNAKCRWTIGGETGKTVPDRDCQITVNDQRVPTNQAIAVSVVAQNESGASIQGSVTVEARDVLIVGLGDSTASGEGNPTRPVALNDNGFCFRRVLLRDRDRFFLPGRAKANVIADCPLPGETRDQRDEWEAANAEWLFAPCHLSLYSYQSRAAIALAAENPSLSVTYYPMGCTGATIREGMLGKQRARERPRRGGQTFPRDVSGQIEQLSSYLRVSGTNPNPARHPDLIFLTVGGNDLKFSGLVADLLIAEDPERGILRRQKLISGPADSRQMFGPLAEDFKALRRSLLRLTGSSLERVIFVNYSNPAMHQGDKICPTSRRGVDAHPAFAVDGRKVEQAVAFVEEEFLPRLKAYATCGGGAGCSDPNRERMTYVDEHMAAFRHHGFCAVDAHDPVFDRECFRDGDSFNTSAQGGLNDPLKCSPAARNFRPYSKRARWIRTVNDSFFTAMTYPAMGALANPADIHDGLWGVASVVYGGAIHPTGEGHAAMADAALPAARQLLGLPAPARDEGSN
jgi:hypothetical protein